MRRILFIIAGSLLFLGIGIIATTITSDWVSVRFIRSDDDMNTLGKIIFLGVFPSLIVVGGWIGNVLFKRNLTLRSRERTDKRRTP